MTRDELIARLPSMSEAARRELLGLLEAKVRLRQGSVAEDTTTALSDLLKAAQRHVANGTDDPEGWMASNKTRAYNVARQLRRLRRGKPRPVGLEEILAFTLPTHPDLVEAKRLAAGLSMD